MSQNLSIQGSPSPTVVTQQTNTPAPTSSRNVYLAIAVVSAIALVVSAIFLNYIVKNYTDSHGYFVNDTAMGLFTVSEIGILLSAPAFLASAIGFFMDKADPQPPPVVHNEQEVVR